MVKLSWLWMCFMQLNWSERFIFARQLHINWQTIDEALCRSCVPDQQAKYFGELLIYFVAYCRISAFSIFACTVWLPHMLTKYENTKCSDPFVHFHFSFWKVFLRESVWMFYLYSILYPYFYLFLPRVNCALIFSLFLNFSMSYPKKKPGCQRWLFFIWIWIHW